MVDSPTTRNRLRKQEVGTNNNTWGTKLNEVLDCVDQVVDGVEAVDLGAATSYTLTTSDYTTTDQAKNRVLVCSNLNAAGSDLIVPNVEHVYGVRNSGATTLEVKTSAGTGVEIPASRFTWVYCDGTNVISAAATSLPAAFVPTLDNDPATVDYVDTAIAAAGTLTPATVRVSGGDTTSAFLQSKVNVTGSGAASVVESIGSAGGNETLDIAISVGALGLTDGGTQAVGFTAASNTRYNCVFGAAGTITLPAAPAVKDVIGLHLAGNYVYTLAPNGLKINASTANYPLLGNQTVFLEYTGATDGWV